MLLSRFWYFIVALALGAAVAGLFLAEGIYNRVSREAMDQALSADTQVVTWYLNDDARRRSSLLLKVVLDDTIRDQLAKATKADKVSVEITRKTNTSLTSLAESMPKDYGFTALFAVDGLGRVVGHVGFEQASGIDGFDLGGYPVVADALHGWVRDDSWVLDGRIYLVVARPVEVDTSQMPVGAVVGLRMVDTAYVKQLVKRSGAAVGFYADNTVKVKAAPEGFDSTKLDTIVSDIRNLETDEKYKSTGKSPSKILMGDVGVIYSKIPGEAWELGAGYVVGRAAGVVDGPAAFIKMADENDKKAISWPFVIGVFLAASVIGLVFTFFEHTRPLRTLRGEAEAFAKGEADILHVSRFRGVYRKIASDLNDGTDKVAAKGGAPRKAADLESVLGPIPAQPSMSAFSFPMEAPASGPGAPQPPAPKGIAAPAPSSPQVIIKPPPPKPAGPAPSVVAAPKPAAPAPNGPKAPAPRTSDNGADGAAKPAAAAASTPKAAPVAAAPPSSSAGDPEDDDDATVVSAIPPEILQASATGAHAAVKEADEISEWHNIFEEFKRTKKQCGEPTEGLTFEKFQNTLRKNREQLISKTNCKKVRFSVYVKDGRAALKASPIRQ